ncbi:NUDIX hydrolase [Leucobacter chinensis]|uniref:NUDIX hydrolase n=1 Tax=Leucobacter chinensis TaxID=2851010 RepID=UPI001C21E3AC|nr:NUDIX domain-containing protein [Leucobacter chinensis]
MSAAAQAAPQKTVLAAGTVPWRYTKSGGIKVLLIRRRKHNDWSFPKGKLDKGESLPAAAVRETEEETGLDLALGTTLGTINYTVGDAIAKTVQYWAAHVSAEHFGDYEFEPNDEVKRVKWVRVEKVRDRLTYPADQELFGVFEQLVVAGAQDTFGVILLRHAKAEPRGEAFTQDALRPLRASGVKQAQTIAPVLAAFSPETIVTSPATRCAETVDPVAKLLEITPRLAPEVSQDTWDEGDVSGLRELVNEVLATETNAIICSHRPVLPDLAREIAAVNRTRPGRYLTEATELPPAAFSVFHISKAPSEQGIVSVETYPIKA